MICTSGLFGPSSEERRRGLVELSESASGPASGLFLLPDGNVKARKGRMKIDFLLRSSLVKHHWNHSSDIQPDHATSAVVHCGAKMEQTGDGSATSTKVHKQELNATPWFQKLFLFVGHFHLPSDDTSICLKLERPDCLFQSET